MRMYRPMPNANAYVLIQSITRERVLTFETRPFCCETWRWIFASGQRSVGRICRERYLDDPIWLYSSCVLARTLG